MYLHKESKPLEDNPAQYNPMIDYITIILLIGILLLSTVITIAGGIV